VRFKHHLSPCPWCLDAPLSLTQCPKQTAYLLSIDSSHVFGSLFLPRRRCCTIKEFPYTMRRDPPFSTGNKTQDLLRDRYPEMGNWSGLAIDVSILPLSCSFSTYSVPFAFFSHLILLLSPTPNLPYHSLSSTSCANMALIGYFLYENRCPRRLFFCSTILVSNVRL
jgi:hypothetical protein